MTPRIQPVDHRSSRVVDATHARQRPRSQLLDTAMAYEMAVLKEQTNDERWSDANIQKVVKQWKLSDLEEQQLRQIKLRMADLDHWKNNPLDVVRYLRGPGKFEQVEGKIREMIEWRIQYGADSLLETYRPPRTLLYYVPSAILKGYDREGDPIYLERGGVMDGVGLQRYSRDDIVRHIIWLREIGTRGHWIQDFEKKTGRTPSQVTIIYDMQGMSSRHLKAGVIPMFQAIVKVNQQRYCGLAKRIIVLRAPPIFNFIWNMAKHFFPPEGQKLMVFTGPSNYLKVLDKFVDRKVLPPCICKEGRGTAMDCMPQNFEGGNLPPNAEASIPDEPWITELMNTAKTMKRREQERQRRLAPPPPKVKEVSAETLFPPVCLSHYLNVQVLNIPQAQWQDEYETVLVR
ncbi:SEC14-like protein 4 [Seminavis robusta]|uniref:SEC14-like protein 4 n=1 Tax=Seminavis robusta TaxID=568900 RepID=A0A9N8H5B5_9STRA|nr:SEC14-like protein 4 [Seminavis robusta]|eukprot:Sro109_g054600.1 SEC14-like protein 4 (402) ;mRNA; f:76157-77503